MLNHRTKATEVNSSLQQQEKKVVKQYGGSAEGVYFQGFFAINAGVACMTTSAFLSALSSYSTCRCAT